MAARNPEDPGLLIKNADPRSVKNGHKAYLIDEVVMLVKKENMETVEVHSSDSNTLPVDASPVDEDFSFDFAASSATTI